MKNYIHTKQQIVYNTSVILYTDIYIYVSTISKKNSEYGDANETSVAVTEKSID